MKITPPENPLSAQLIINFSWVCRDFFEGPFSVLVLASRPEIIRRAKSRLTGCGIINCGYVIKIPSLYLSLRISSECQGVRRIPNCNNLTVIMFVMRQRKMWVRWPTPFSDTDPCPLRVFTFRRQQRFHFTKHCTYGGAERDPIKTILSARVERNGFTHIETRYALFPTSDIISNQVKLSG